jgi:hypothetical protein
MTGILSIVSAALFQVPGIFRFINPLLKGFVMSPQAGWILQEEVVPRLRWVRRWSPSSASANSLCAHWAGANKLVVMIGVGEEPATPYPYKPYSFNLLPH